MDKVLNRKMFRQQYLGVQKPQGFQTGGIADPKLTISDEEVEKELGLENTKPKVETPVETEDKDFATGITKILSLDDTSGGLTRNQKMISYLAPIAAALLTGDQRAGESKISGTFRALGLGMAQLLGTIQAIAASDLEARGSKGGGEILMPLQEMVQRGIIPADSVDEFDKGFGKVVVDMSTKSGFRPVDTPEITVEGTDLRNRFYEKTINKVDRQLMDAINQGLELAKGYVERGENIPGVGPLDKYTGELTAEGKAVKQIIQAIKNIVTKQRSGSAVTGNEMERLQKEFGDGVFAGDKELINFLYNAKRSMNKSFRTALNSLPKTNQESMFNEINREYYLTENVMGKDGKVTIQEYNPMSPYISENLKKSELQKAKEDNIQIIDIK
tara:strand:- start:821 stop:1981 length:1161 start_codon:yes stop_codon:yes gene_type:complete